MSMSVETSWVIGNVRVQPLGRHLVRIEQRGAKGFEDRETFTVCGRGKFSPAKAVLESAGTGACVATDGYRVVVPEGGAGLEGVRVESANGGLLCELSAAMLGKKFLPGPSALPSVWVLGDSPRVVPAARGALPPPKGQEDPESGWDVVNDAPDAYVFFPSASGYAEFRADFLRLTGGIPLVPLYALGLWYSRYYPYDEDGALRVMDRFRSAGIPLDVFVADTDWRVGASCGYEINTKLFPDMGRFIRRAHDRQVRIMLNDHPEPKGKRALDPEELRFRQQGLTSLLALGADVWWFDRNWHTHLQAPAPGLEKEVWGMRLYHDIVRDFRPDRRPLIMSNVDGINNGRMDTPSHPAAHRFPVWWTGDTCAEWCYLQWGVRNGVDSGIVSLLPYVHEDLGGHHGQTEPELYVRFLQFGALSPVARLHCTTKVHRYPWEYGPEVERIVGEFFRLRYRLLPMLYAAAFEASRSGTPLMRRCDLEWPEHPEATDSTQYLLGDDLLVAPIVEPARGGIASRAVWIPPGQWQDLWSGQMHCGPITIGVKCPLEEIPLFVRRGGLVMTAPQRMSSGEAFWPELVVDAYAPMRDGRQTRLLYEDDGWSTACGRGGAACTDFSLGRSGTRMDVAMKPVPMRERVGVKRRVLTLRIQLPPGAEAERVTCDGRRLESGEYAWILPCPGHADGILTGPESAPPVLAGPVLEWRGEVEAVQALHLVVDLHEGGTGESSG